MKAIELKKLLESASDEQIVIFESRTSVEMSAEENFGIDEVRSEGNFFVLISMD